jgi:hypothetical protein
MRKQFVYAFFLITLIHFSCCPRCNEWKLAVIKADCPAATYAKAYLPPCNPFNGLEAVFISCSGDIRLYFNALTLLFPCYADEEHSEVFITIEEEHYCFIAERLLGGQTLLLPEEAMLLITLAFLEKKDVEVIAGRYTALLTHQNFEKIYRNLIY